MSINYETCSLKSPKEEGFIKFNKYFRFTKWIGSGSFGKVVLANDLL